MGIVVPKRVRSSLPRTYRSVPLLTNLHGIFRPAPKVTWSCKLGFQRPSPPTLMSARDFKVRRLLLSMSRWPTVSASRIQFAINSSELSTCSPAAFRGSCHFRLCSHHSAAIKDQFLSSATPQLQRVAKILKWSSRTYTLTICCPNKFLNG